MEDDHLVSHGKSGADGWEIKMAEYEDAEFTFFHEHIERHLHVKQLLLKTIWNLYGSSTTKVTNKECTELGREGRKCNLARTSAYSKGHTRGGGFHSLRDPPWGMMG